MWVDFALLLVSQTECPVYMIPANTVIFLFQRLLVIGRLQNRCGDSFLFFVLPTGKYVTNFPIYKV